MKQNDINYGTQLRLIEKNMIFNVEKGYNTFCFYISEKSGRRLLTKDEISQLDFRINYKII